MLKVEVDFEVELESGIGRQIRSTERMEHR